MIHILLRYRRDAVEVGVFKLARVIIAQDKKARRERRLDIYRVIRPVAGALSLRVLTPLLAWKAPLILCNKAQHLIEPRVCGHQARHVYYHAQQQHDQQHRKHRYAHKSFLELCYHFAASST